MKAAVFYGKKEIRQQEYPMPRARTGQLVVKVCACGICGTDVHIYNGDKGMADTTPPIILGHEFAGIVTETSSGVTNFAVGDRVAVDPNIQCGNCYYCKNGMGHFCRRMTGIGTTSDGGFAEYVAVPASQAYKIADTTTFAEGAMAEPVACCLHGIDLCDIRPGRNVAIIGGGMIGLIMLQLARLSGAATLALIEPVASKRDMAKQLGADLVIDPAGQDPLTVLREKDLTQLDVVIECVGRKETMEQAVAIAGRAATVMLFGLTAPDDRISVKPFELFQKEISLKASFINPYTMQRAIALIDQGKIDVTTMVNEPIPLASLGEVLASPEKRRTGKFIVCPGLES